MNGWRAAIRGMQPRPVVRLLRLTKTQIDRLGERLKKGDSDEFDLRLLDEYRRSFGEPYELVVRSIRASLALKPTGRPAKSTTSIVEKLRRESIRLSQMQDIAGCRIVVSDLTEQDRVVDGLRRLFSDTIALDRRRQPSHGYRAVHVVADVDGRPIEIQVRTLLQDFWARLSEKFSDVVDPAIKYGHGPVRINNALRTLSARIYGSLERRMCMVVDRSRTEIGREAAEFQATATRVIRHDAANPLERGIADLFKEAALDNAVRMLVRHTHRRGKVT